MSPSLFLFNFPVISQRHYPPCSFLLLLLLVTTSYAAPTSSEYLATSEFKDYVLQNVFYNQDQCYKDSFVYIKETDSKAGAYRVLAKTKECANWLRKEGTLTSDLPFCPPGLIDFDVKPLYVPKNQLSYPFANFNISITAHSNVETIAFRLECLSASDGQDVYCANNKLLFIDGVKEWPCRALQFFPSVHFPARFAYSCFRLTPHSVYAINATIFPQRCRSVQFVTAPSFDDMFPVVLMDPKDDDDRSVDPFWSPLLSADVSDPSGVWIRFGKARKAKCDKMMVNIYKERETDSSKVSFVQTLEVKCPDDGVKWENLLAGKYLLIAYVPIRGCKFMCEADESNCHQCLRTHLNIHIDDDKAAFTWIVLQKFNDSSFELLIISLIIGGIVIVSMLIYLAVYLYRKRKEAKQIQEIPLRQFVKTMVVYADDNAPHLQVIRLFVDSLRSYATCEPIFDVEKVLSPECNVVPSRWLIDQVGSLPKFAIVMSECASKILDTTASATHHLVQNRPFADLFGPAMEMIIRDVTYNSAAARKKYCIVRLPYSPEVPANLALLGLPMFNLPGQFANLVAFLHNVPLSKKVSLNQMLSQHRLTEWTRFCGVYQQYVEAHPNWIDRRWRPKDEPVQAFRSVAPLAEEEVIRTHEDRVRLSEKYGIEPPGGSDSEEEATDETPFVLHPKRLPDEVDSDSEADSESDSDDSNKTVKHVDVEAEMLTSSESPMNTVVYLGPGPMPGTSQASVPAESTEQAEETPAGLTEEAEQNPEEEPSESKEESEEKPTEPSQESEEKPAEATQVLEEEYPEEKPSTSDS